MDAFRDDVMADRVALVTGGGTGIGREIARTLGQHGARLALCGRRAEVLEETRKAFEAEGLECLVVPCDVRKPEQVEHVVASTLDRFGKLDLVVNNAAGNFPAPMSGISYNGFKAVVDIDLLGTYNVSKAAFESTLKQNGGDIVNISAPFQHMGVALQAHVAAAKTGVDSLTRTCAVEWGPYGIRVNGVAPGHIAETEGVARFEAAAEADASSAPLRRGGVKRDIANAVLFFASPAASYVSGQILYVDGGSGVDALKLRLD